MEWIPSKLGADQIIETYGQERWSLLETLLHAQMGGHNVLAGKCCKLICEKGGMFGVEDLMVFAQMMRDAIAIVRGSMEVSVVPEGMKAAIEALSLLELPEHPVKSLPQHRRPIWEQVGGDGSGGQSG